MFAILLFMGRLDVLACLRQVAKGSMDGFTLFGRQGGYQIYKKVIGSDAILNQPQALLGEPQFLVAPVERVFYAVHQPLLHQPFHQLAGGRLAGIGEATDFRELAFARVINVKQGIYLRHGKTGLVHELHEVLVNVSQDIFQAGMGRRNIHFD
jgi:hypothetical protein